MEDLPKSDQIWELLTHHSKLERDKGQARLEEMLVSQKTGPLDRDLRATCESFITAMNDECPWESKLGLLLASKALVRQTNNSSVDESRHFVELLTESCVSLLAEKEEVRVRGLAAEVLGEMCHQFGPEIYLQVRERVLEIIQSNLERETDRLKLDESSHFKDAHDGSSDDEDVRSTVSSNAEEIFHDTAGWKNLESSMNCLEYMVEGCGSGFLPYITPDLVELIVTSLKHTNRFVRETGYNTLTSFLRTGKLSVMEGPVLQEKVAAQFAKHIAIGLADNWSQVRLAASVACRELFLSISDDEAKKEAFYPILLPRLCLNRYYMAEGVKLYNQQTWKLTVGDQGRVLVEKHIQEVINYYVMCTLADNHAVREAACLCIGELAVKISRPILLPHVKSLVEVFCECFQDHSWPVRDTACVASGNFIRMYPTECQDKISILMPMFLGNLKDPISSVRQGAALSLANVLQAYPEVMFDPIKEILIDGFAGLSDQPEESQRYQNLSSENATFGVVKKLRDNDVELHENQPMYSCGSLAPKMGRGGTSGGCSSAMFKKNPEPWEFADGCVHLFTELTSLADFHAKLHPLVSKISQACYKRHYTLHLSFIETVLKRLPDMAERLGKRYFKPYLEDFMDPIFYAFGSENALARVAAEHCLAYLSQWLGPNILRGRVEQVDPKYLELLEQAMMQSPMSMEMGTVPSSISIPPKSEQHASYQHLGGTPT
ncbi:hypothetical protein TCAL_14582 [Tigriopus californicus]|uniref:Dynein axonemal assembly factor 5 TPR repeats domain-containing protein n=1 Tax=Tigriopus californicus TaxID=6832 RepID=A0A553PBW2_TIGCA|nr:uncharacterized protein LOC131893066 [Tigriopus californicus]TRY75172.1 hypothetical protein TCAL_14582 [Tigriopus californicus]